MTARYRLQKCKRLSERQDITAVFDNANAIRHPNLVLLGRVNGLDYPRLAIIVAKKNVKHASARNRLKRLIRESFRGRQQALPKHDYIVIVRRGLAELTNTDITAVLEKQWAKYQQRYAKSA